MVSDLLAFISHVRIFSSLKCYFLSLLSVSGVLKNIRIAYVAFWFAVEILALKLPKAFLLGRPQVL